MSDEIDYDFTPNQWEALKALRMPALKIAALNPVVLDDLVAFGLATMSDNVPAITPKGRKALIRGSSRLWDVAA
jgi:hypothetical protein